MGSPLLIDTVALGALCRAHGVSRLQIFGSALTDGFEADRSDVDLLVEFAQSAEDAFEAYFGLKEDLEVFFKRPVDLIMARSMTNPYFARSASDSAHDLYAA